MAETFDDTLKGNEDKRTNPKSPTVDELDHIEGVQSALESAMPVEDLRTLHYASPPFTNLPISKQDDVDSSDENSSGQEGSGYQRLLIAEHTSTNDDEDTDDASFTFDCQKVIKTGEQYQAVVPDFLASADANGQESPNDQMLWSPSVDTEHDDNLTLVSKYLKLAAKEHPSADQELVLEVLLSTNYEADQALDKLRSPSTNKNFYCGATWTLTECEQFEQCFKDYGKDFSLFKIPNRSVHELVFFYYIWKKSARHDVFVRQHRVEKRRFHLHPYVTDYLEKFFIEHELQLTNANAHNNSSMTPLNPQLSADQLLSKRRLSSELFLKPSSIVKRTKPSINTNDSDLNRHSLDALDLTERPAANESTSVVLKKSTEEIL